jgi:hypothetical protein
VTKSCTGIIPQNLNTPQQLGEVKAFLKSLHIDPQDRQELLFAWARNVGLKLRPPDYEFLLD